MSRLEQKYKEVVTPSLMKKFNCKSVMEVPHVDKIAINIGIGEATSNPEVLNGVVAELAQIAGQAPVIIKAEKSTTNFKLYEKMPIGCKVTLGKEEIYDFTDKLMNISLPRVRDFRGVSVISFDGRGNYTLGVKEQLIFLEIDYDKINKVCGMDIIIVTTANTNEEAKVLLEEMDMPLRKQEDLGVYGKKNNG